MPIKINGATSGSTTITAPATGSDESIELSTALASKLDSTALLGKILQITEGVTTTETLVASTSFTDTTLTASITPSSASNKILIVALQQIRAYREQNSEIAADVQLVRGVTAVTNFGQTVGGRAGLSSGSDIYYYGLVPFVFLDSPATTSATTYKTQIRASTVAANGRVTAQNASTHSRIFLLEVAA